MKKAAISTDTGMVSEHFGRCPEFTIIEFEAGELKKKETIANPGHHPGYLPEFLKKMGVGYIVAGGMGMRAQNLFNAAGIEIIVGISGSIDEVVRKILDGSLAGGASLCSPGKGKSYGIPRTEAEIDGKKYSGSHKDLEEENK